MTLLAGTMFGPYEILAQIGAGGMGDVYRAKDTRLDRSVAVKVVRGEFTERFEREAKAISALNHPHICTLYDIGKEGDTRYLVMEYIEGGTLAARLRKGPIEVEQALRIASEMASALDAAHRKGIAHRDLKPGNVMLTKAGVKLLDFGLAKMARSSVPASGMTVSMTSPITAHNTILGTPQYMAPEQIEGAETDHRADIFSFGCVLYEMMTGKPPFEGKSATSVMAAILERPAPPLPAGVTQFDWLVRHCLEKEPDARFQSIHDVRLGLERAQIPEAAPPKLGSSRREIAAWAAAGLALVALAGVALWKPRAPAAAPFRVLTRITSDLGVTTRPDISPDGKLVVYSSDRDGQKNLDLYVQQIPGGTPVRITNTDDDETEPAFSPDGTQIAFHSSKGEGGIYVMPALGGEPRLLVRGGHTPQYSPDGASIAYWTGSLTSGDPFSEGAAKSFVIPSAGGTPRQIRPEFTVVRAPKWSPDGGRLLFEGVVAGEGATRDRADIWTAPLEGGAAQRTGLFAYLNAISPRGTEIYRWSREGLLISTGTIRNLYRVPVDAAGKPSGPPLQLTNGTDQVRYAAVSHSGRLVFSSGGDHVNAWGVPVDGNSGKTTGVPYRITEDLAGIAYPSLSPDGRSLLYASNRNGSYQIWMRDLVGGKSKAIITGPGAVTAPVFLRSGRIAFRGGGGMNVNILVPSTGESHLINKAGYLSDTEPKEEFATLRGQTGDLATVDVLDLRSGRNVPLFRAPHWNLYQARFSPDGRWIAFLAQIHSGTGRIYAARFHGMQQIPQAEWMPIVDGLVDKPRFSPDGKLIYFTRDGEGSRSIQAVRFDEETGKTAGDPFLVYDFRGPRLSMVPVGLGPLELAVGRDKLVTLVAESTSNIWMTELDEKR